MRYLAAFFAFVLFGATPIQALTAPVDYGSDVKPILERRCYACHGAFKQEAGLRLDTGAAIRQGAESGPVVMAGNPDESVLLARISAADEAERMPPEGEPLAADEIGKLRAWIEQGAQSPADEQPQADPRGHWSFQPIVRPPLPTMAAGESGNPIDAFLGAAHAKMGLEPAPPAEKRVQARRVYLDLVGVPPTPDELHAFLADESPTAYEALVDRLLASPRHAERWARHWMDVWRYSDWYGRRGEGEIRYSQRHIWRWRDWIIESLAADKGYDQMVTEMLAADEAAPADVGAARATGFLGRNWYKFDRDAWLFETVEQTSVAFLGVTMRCCRCHDHKFDPITQHEYYQLRAFFEPHDFRIDPAPHGDESKSSGESSAGLARAFDKQLDAATWFYRRGDPRQADKETPLGPATPAVLGAASLEIQPVSLPLEAYYPAMRPDALAAAQAAAEKLLREASGDEARLRSAEASRAALLARIEAERARIAGAANATEAALAAGRAERAAAIAIAEEGLAAAEKARAALDAAAAEPAIAEADKKIADAKQALETARAAATALDASPQSPEAAKYAPLGEIYPSTSSGRRLALARWITSRDNPRASRVAVNQIWLRHFGEPLVPTVANFGLAGKPPALPELLDWLASELQDSGWSMKHLHRLIVTSNAYRRSSGPTRERGSADVDPENHYCWRMNSRRLEAEVIRDSVLAISNGLDTTIGGPELDESLGQASRRRSLYFRVTPDNKMEMLELFDLANPNECYRRGESVTPQQALAMSNSALVQSESRVIACLACADAGSSSPQPEAFIAAAFERVLGRLPTDEERALCTQFLHDQPQPTGDGAADAFPPSPQPASVPPSADAVQRAREDLVHVLLNHHEFLTAP
jgi:hypothetical protein